MKSRFYLIFFSGLLLITVSYAQILHKITVKNDLFNTELTDCSEESTEKSSEEKSRETDQDEDPFRLNEMISVLISNRLSNSTNGYRSLDHSGHHPEIISPPPQAC